MAKNDDAKAVKKAERAAKRDKRRRTRAQMWQAFTLQKSRDPRLVPYMILAFLAPIIVLLIIGLLIGGTWAWFLPILGASLGVLAAMWLFTRRLQNSMYGEIEDQPGAAGWALDNLRSGLGTVWHVKHGAQANQHMDAVHRVVGNPGIVLVGEGEPGRVKGMMAREKKQLSRFVGETPIYEIHAGVGEGRVHVKHLQREMMRLPRNLDKDKANQLASRLESMDGLRDARANMPKGPLPKGGHVGGMNRRARRTAARNRRG